MMYLIAVLLPPVAVLLCGRPIQALLNCLLTLCLWVPGIIHAVMIVSDRKADQRMDRFARSMGR